MTAQELFDTINPWVSRGSEAARDALVQLKEMAERSPQYIDPRELADYVQHAMPTVSAVEHVIREYLSKSTEWYDSPEWDGLWWGCSADGRLWLMAIRDQEQEWRVGLDGGAVRECEIRLSRFTPIHFPEPPPNRDMAEIAARRLHQRFLKAGQDPPLTVGEIAEVIRQESTNG